MRFSPATDVEDPARPPDGAATRVSDWAVANPITALNNVASAQTTQEHFFFLPVLGLHGVAHEWIDLSHRLDRRDHGGPLALGPALAGS
jgi:hypothetical protein